MLKEKGVAFLGIDESLLSGYLCVTLLEANCRLGQSQHFATMSDTGGNGRVEGMTQEGKIAGSGDHF